MPTSLTNVPNPAATTPEFTEDAVLRMLAPSHPGDNVLAMSTWANMQGPPELGLRLALLSNLPHDCFSSCLLIYQMRKLILVLSTLAYILD